MRRTHVHAALAAGLAALAVPTAAAAAGPTHLLRGAVAAEGASARACQARPARTGEAGITTRRVTASATGFLTARLTGAAGDWDLAVFGARSRRHVASSAAPGTRELAQGFVYRGERLVVQACRREAADRDARLRVSVLPIDLPAGLDRVQMLRVKTPTAADVHRLGTLGLDLTEHGREGFRDVVSYGAADEGRLRRAGFGWDVRIADLVRHEIENALRDRLFAKRAARFDLPSGRDGYRHLADYESELKQLAAQNPGLVRLITLPHPSLEGRPVIGVEIAKDVNVDDGRPTMVQVGVHHAREWPAGEHPMEWAHELVKGYGKDPRVTKIVDESRTVVVPIVNPDGFNLSREAQIDLGNPLAMIDLPPEIDSQLPVQDPTYTAALLADQTIGFYAFKRRNCRVKDGEVPAEGDCANPDNRTLGVDPNRNYGGYWGGPGADISETSDTYRGPGPFSEPEVQNVRELVAGRQATGLITNHTFSNLILRPPGIRSLGDVVDEPAYKALSDAMAAQNGYASIHGYSLYDTTGTTEDWSYPVTGGFGFTFEIGPDEFHPPFQEMIDEYVGAGEYAGKGNREAYFLAGLHAADASKHSVIKGRAPRGTRLVVRKTVSTPTSDVLRENEDGETVSTAPLNYSDTLGSSMTVPRSGRFEWHVNPSTRPFVALPSETSTPAKTPAFEEDISTPLPPLPANTHEFEVKPDAARQIQVSTTALVPDSAGDIDIYLYQDSIAAENQVASSAGGTGDETISFDNPRPGKYILEVRNFSSAGGYDGVIRVVGAEPGTVVRTPAQRESWTFSCIRRGKTTRTRKVFVARGQIKNLGRKACAPVKKKATRKPTRKPARRK